MAMLQLEVAMPWAEVDVSKLREEFVDAAKVPGANIAELCREHGISRKTGYKWLKRFEEHGLAGLKDQSRKPKQLSGETDAEVVMEVVRVRHAHPRWGPRTIRSYLTRHGMEKPPSERTIARILDRCGLLKKRRSRKPATGRPVGAPNVTVEAPNDLWTTDFKGWWVTGDRTRCEPLGIRDAMSRFVLRLDALSSPAYKPTRECFEFAFEQFGLPSAILSDNGQPFACTSALWGLTQLSAWWISLGIEVVRTRVGCPQDNGGHERMHVDIALDVQTSPSDTLEVQQEALDGWRLEFNHVRPHHALDLKCPADVYVPSARKMPLARAGGFPEGCALRSVIANGCTNYRGHTFFISKALRGHQIGFLRHADELTEVWFHHVRLGELDLESERVIPTTMSNDALEVTPETQC